MIIIFNVWEIRFSRKGSFLLVRNASQKRHADYLEIKFSKIKYSRKRRLVAPGREAGAAHSARPKHSWPGSWSWWGPCARTFRTRLWVTRMAMFGTPPQTPWGRRPAKALDLSASYRTLKQHAARLNPMPSYRAWANDPQEAIDSARLASVPFMKLKKALQGHESVSGADLFGATNKADLVRVAHRRGVRLGPLLEALNSPPGLAADSLPQVFEEPLPDASSSSSGIQLFSENATIVNGGQSSAAANGVSATLGSSQPAESLRQAPFVVDPMELATTKGVAKLFEYLGDSQKEETLDPKALASIDSVSDPVERSRLRALERAQQRKGTGSRQPVSRSSGLATLGAYAHSGAHVAPGAYATPEARIPQSLHMEGPARVAAGGIIPPPRLNSDAHGSTSEDAPFAYRAGASGTGAPWASLASGWPASLPQRVLVTSSDILQSSSDFLRTSAETLPSWLQGGDPTALPTAVALPPRPPRATPPSPAFGSASGMSREMRGSTYYSIGREPEAWSDFGYDRLAEAHARREKEAVRAIEAVAAADAAKVQTAKAAWTRAHEPGSAAARCVELGQKWHAWLDNVKVLLDFSRFVVRMGASEIRRASTVGVSNMSRRLSSVARGEGWKEEDDEHHEQRKALEVKQRRQSIARIEELARVTAPSSTASAASAVDTAEDPPSDGEGNYDSDDNDSDDDGDDEEIAQSLAPTPPVLAARPRKSSLSPAGAKASRSSLRGVSVVTFDTSTMFGDDSPRPATQPGIETAPQTAPIEAVSTEPPETTSESEPDPLAPPIAYRAPSPGDSALQPSRTSAPVEKVGRMSNPPNLKLRLDRLSQLEGPTEEQRLPEALNATTAQVDALSA